MALLPELARIALAQMTFKRVCIWHPGCRQLLFCLPAYTHPTSAGTNCNGDGAVNHRLVLDACHIITNHAAEERDCYLSRDRAGQNPVVPCSGAGLAPGKYYYQPGPPSSRTVANYPIVTDFAAWRYPWWQFPDHWKRHRSFQEKVDISLKHRFSEPEEFGIAVSLDDHASCVVTKQYSACEVVRLVPLDHEDWFECNSMNPCNWGGEFDKGTSDPANGLVLRLDLADLFESHAFVFFPAGDGRFMTYMCRLNLDYVPLLHRRLVTVPLRVSDEFLYARFGHSIISLVRKGSHLNTFPIPEDIKPSEPEVMLRSWLPSDEVDTDDDYFQMFARTITGPG